MDKKIIEKILVDFIMYEKQSITFYTREDAKKYLTNYMKMVSK